MSRSTRKPYSAVTGVRSAKKDKQQAARGLRRKQNQWLRTSDCQNEHSLIPHRLECTWNQVYCWGAMGVRGTASPRGANGLSSADWSRDSSGTLGKKTT